MGQPESRAQGIAQRGRQWLQARLALSSRSERKLVVALLVLLALGYGVQVASPLRINTDAYRLLSMAVSAYHGQAYLVDGQADQYPPAYPFVVKVLLQAGLASSATLITLNLLCLLVGLLALRSWVGDRGGAALPAVWVLSSWVMVKHITLPLSDAPYLALASLALLLVMRFDRRRGAAKWWSFAAAALLAVLALECRTVGVTLFPVLAVAAVLHPDHAAAVARVRINRRYLPAIAGAAAMAGLGAWLAVRGTSWYDLQFARSGGYWQSWLALYRREGPALLLDNARYRVLELGNVFANAPSHRAVALLRLDYLVGLAAWAAMGYGAWRLLREPERRPLVVYFLSYAALLALWPYYDPRFWLPLLPVLAILLLSAVDGLAGRWPAACGALRPYLAGFVVLGMLALLFSTRISLSGRDFSEYYGDGSYTMTYRLAFHNGREVDMSQVSAGTVELLRVLEPLAAAEPPAGQVRSGPAGD